MRTLYRGASSHARWLRRLEDLENFQGTQEEMRKRQNSLRNNSSDDHFLMLNRGRFRLPQAAHSCLFRSSMPVPTICFLGRTISSPPYLNADVGVYLGLHVFLSVPSSLPASWYTVLTIDELFPVFGLLRQCWGDAVRIVGSCQVSGVHERRNAAATVSHSSFLMTVIGPIKRRLLYSLLRCYPHVRYTTRVDAGVHAYKLAVLGWEERKDALGSSEFSLPNLEEDVAAFEVSSSAIPEAASSIVSPSQAPPLRSSGAI